MSDLHIYQLIFWNICYIWLFSHPIYFEEVPCEKTPWCVLFWQTYVVNTLLHPAHNLHPLESGQSSYRHLEMFPAAMKNREQRREESESNTISLFFACMCWSAYKYTHTNTTGVHFMCKYKSKRVLVCLFAAFSYSFVRSMITFLVACLLCAYVCAYVHVCSRLVRFSPEQPLFTRLCAQDDKWIKITLLPSGVTCDRLMKRFIVPNTCALCRGKPFWHTLSHSLLH